jgi:predicted anti-sigma-YlaC factor YlaD
MDSRLLDLIRKIAQTQDEEINCSECLDLISRFVDLDLAGENAGQRLPQVELHLQQCQVCLEEYRLLRDLARKYAAGDFLDL